MAVDYGAGNTSRYYTAPHAAALDIPSGNWGWFFWIRMDVTPTTANRFVISSGTVGGTPSMHVYALTTGAWRCDARDDAGISFSPNSADSSLFPGGDGKNRLLVITKESARTRLYFCEPGGAAVQVSSTGNVIGTMTAPTDWRFGVRADLSAGTFYEEHFGELGVVARGIVPAEIEALARGMAPTRLFGSALTFWMQFAEPAATLRDLVGTVDATQSGSSWPAASEHFPMRLGGAIYLRPQVAAAPVYGQTKFRLYNDDGTGLGEAA